MLEILLLIRIVPWLSKIATKKRRSRGWAALGVGLWFGGEVMGTGVGYMLGLDLIESYGIALTMAAVGMVVAFLVLHALPPRLVTLST